MNVKRSVVCQKEELDIERDSYKEKFFKLNRFLLDTQSCANNHDNLLEFSESKNSQQQFKDLDTMLGAVDRRRIGVCVDELISQNKYLTESNRNLKNELDYLKAKIKPKNKQQQQQQNAELEHTRADLIGESSSLINKKKVRIQKMILNYRIMMF